MVDFGVLGLYLWRSCQFMFVPCCLAEIGGGGYGTPTQRLKGCKGGLSLVSVSI